MSLKPQPISPVPEETARIARAAYPKGNVYMFAEGLSDRQAADAVRGRIDVKYALSLDLSDPGFDASMLREFRARLIAGHAEEQLLTAIVLATYDIQRKNDSLPPQLPCHLIPYNQIKSG